MQEQTDSEEAAQSLRDIYEAYSKPSRLGSLGHASADSESLALLYALRKRLGKEKGQEPRP